MNHPALTGTCATYCRGPQHPEQHWGPAVHRNGHDSLPNYFHGGGQEGGRRAGTENVLLLVGLGKAAEVAREQGPATTAHMEAMRDRLQQKLCAALPAVSAKPQDHDC